MTYEDKIISDAAWFKENYNRDDYDVHPETGTWTDDDYIEKVKEGDLIRLAL